MNARGKWVRLVMDFYGLADMLFLSLKICSHLNQYMIELQSIFIILEERRLHRKAAQKHRKTETRPMCGVQHRYR